MGSQTIYTPHENTPFRYITNINISTSGEGQENVVDSSRYEQSIVLAMRDHISDDLLVTVQ